MLGSRRRPVAAVAVLALMAPAAVGCGSGSGDEQSGVEDALEGRAGLTPTYAPTSTTAAPATTSTSSGAPAPTSTSTTTAPPPPADAAPTAEITDPRGDATPGEGGDPAWADLVGARLALRETHFELRIDLGDPAPQSSGGDDRTMNVAAFFDVDGDGQVDYEVWANLSAGGWDGSWFDDRTGAAAYSDDAATDVLVDGGQLVVRFSPAHVGDATRFRWSLASEYGRYATLGTPLTARDDAPDGDVAVSFPA